MTEDKAQSIKTKDYAKLSFEDAMSELEKIVSRLESTDIPIDEAVEIYIRGKELYDYCTKILGDSELKIQNIGAFASRNQSA